MAVITGRDCKIYLNGKEIGLTDTFSFTVGAKEPTEEGKRRYPETVGFYDCEYPCTCTERCDDPCKGQCGCEACRVCYQEFNDFLSGE